MIISSGDGYVRKLLELNQGCQGPFWGARGKSVDLSRDVAAEKGLISG